MAVVVCFACGPKPVVEKVPDLFWPPPPEKPRIKFVDMFRGSGDVRARYGVPLNVLFGSEEEIRFAKPFGVAARGKKIYVTDIGGVVMFDLSDGTSGKIGRNELRSPSGIALTEDRIYVGDNSRHRIYVYDSSGYPIMDFAWKDIGTIAGLAIDAPRKRLIVSDSKRHAIFIFSLDGVLQTTIGNRGKAEGEFNFPYGVAVDRQGRIYVVDSGNFRLQIFSEEGKFLKSFGSVGSSAGQFARPKGVAVDSEGHIYVLDAAFGNFQVFDYDANTLIAVGSNGRGPAQFVLPSSIYIDENDRIYVVDQVNLRIQLFQYISDKTSRIQQMHGTYGKASRKGVIQLSAAIVVG